MFPVCSDVVLDGVPLEDLRADQLGQILVGGGPMCARRAEQPDALRRDTLALDLGEEWRQHRPVRHGTRDVGKDDRDRACAAQQLAEGRPLERGTQRVEHGACLVGKRGHPRWADDDRVVRDVDCQPVAAIG